MGTAPFASAQKGVFEPLTHRNATGKITHLGLSMERTFQNMTYMELLIKAIFIFSSHFCRYHHYINEQNGCSKRTDTGRCGDMNFKASYITHQRRFNRVYYAEYRLKWKIGAKCSLAK
jgi:hypothetical protein